MRRTLAALTVSALLIGGVAMSAVADGAGTPAACETPYGTSGDPTAEYHAPQGWVVTGVCVKAGQLHTGPLGNGVHGCYTVTGVGSRHVTVTRVAPGPACKAISHVDVIKEQQSTTTTSEPTTTTEAPPSTTTTTPVSSSTSSTSPIETTSTLPNDTTTTLPEQSSTTSIPELTSTTGPAPTTTAPGPTTTVQISQTSITPPVVVDPPPSTLTIPETAPSTLPSELPHTGLGAGAMAVAATIWLTLGTVAVLSNKGAHR